MEKSNDILIPEIERLLKNGHMVEFVPRGVSMRPFIEGGRDKVILKRCEKPQVGDIVLARVEESYVLHRIYEKDGDQIILKGDGNLAGEEIGTENDIIGCVVCVKNNRNQRKCLTRACVWRHLPVRIKKYYLKIYRKAIK